MFKKLRDLLLPNSRSATKQRQIENSSKVTVVPNPESHWIGDFEYTVRLTCSGTPYTLNVVTDNLLIKHQVECPGCHTTLELPTKSPVEKLGGVELGDIECLTEYADARHTAIPNEYKRYILYTSPDMTVYPTTSKKCFPGKL